MCSRENNIHNKMYIIPNVGTRLIVQPNSLYLYSKKKNSFDILNYESLIFLLRFDGTETIFNIQEKLKREYQEIEAQLIEKDLYLLVCFLTERGYYSLQETPLEIPLR